MKTHSTILQWMISRTKKRLYKTNNFVIPSYILALSGLTVCCAFIIQAIRPAPSYGVVFTQMPILHEAIADPLDRYSYEFNNEIVENTPVAILGLDAFIFGHLDSFTKQFYRADNKFRVAHVDGAPDIGTLLETYNKWWMHVNKNQTPKKDETLVLYPVSEIPMPVVIKVLAMLKQSDQFKHVILATDLI